MSKWIEKAWKFFEEEPIYVPEKEAVVDGWKVAYNEQKDRADLAEAKLKKLAELSDGMIKFGWGLDHARKIRKILNMTKEDLDG
jgi:hypothetical protein